MCLFYPQILPSHSHPILIFRVPGRVTPRKLGHVTITKAITFQSAKGSNVSVHGSQSWGPYRDPVVPYLRYGDVWRH